MPLREFISHYLVFQIVIRYTDKSFQLHGLKQNKSFSIGKYDKPGNNLWESNTNTISHTLITCSL